MTNLFQYDCKSGNLHYPDSDHFANFVIFESYKNKSLKSEVPLMIRQVNRVSEEMLNKKPIEGDKNIANAFAKYFEAIPGKTKNKIPAY